METVLLVDPKSSVKELKEGLIEYAGAKFKVAHTSLVVQPNFTPQQPNLIICVGKQALINAFNILFSVYSQIKYIGISAIEINDQQNFYMDLHQPDFQYIKLDHELSFINLKTEKYQSGNFLTDFINRITIKNQKQSQKKSHLFIIKQHCSNANCHETHGEMYILSIGDALHQQIDVILEILQKKKQFERSLLNDLIKKFIAQKENIQLVAGIAPGNEDQLMALLVKCGSFS